MKKIHESIGIYCPNENCRSILGLSEYNDHVPKCKTKGSYKHTNSLREARPNRANDRCCEMIKILEKSCETKKEKTEQTLTPSNVEYSLVKLKVLAFQNAIIHASICSRTLWD